MGQVPVWQRTAQQQRNIPSVCAALTTRTHTMLQYILASMSHLHSPHIAAKRHVHVSAFTAVL
jgi:hypothetical protein